MNVNEEGHFCPNCGASVPSTSHFCPKCGAKIETADGTTPPEVLTPPQPQFAPNTMTGVTEKVHSLTSLCSSPYVLALVIFLTINSLLSLQSVYTALSGILGDLICIGCWICYMGGKKKHLTTSGFTLISVSLIIQTVLATLISVIGIVICIFAKNSANSYVGDDTVDKVFLGLIIAFVCLTAFILIYYIGFIKSVRSAENIVRSGKGQLYSGMFNIVVLILGAVSSLIGFIVSSTVSGILSGYISALSSYVPEIRQLGLNFNFESSFLSNLMSISSIAATITAIIILVKIHNDKQEMTV